MSDRDAPPPRLNEVSAVSLRLASPEDIRSWSSGEVTRADFLKEPEDRPHPDGLFSQRIFGPLHDWCCACATTSGPRYCGPEHRGERCPACGVTIEPALVRRRRMGHIELAVPVAHTWFVRARPSPLALLLGVRPSRLAQVLAYQAHAVVEPGASGLVLGTVLNEEDYRDAREEERQCRKANGDGRRFEVDIGARAIRRLLQQLDFDRLAGELRRELAELRVTARGRSRQEELIARLKVVEALRGSGNRPEWMVLECLPVLPPDLRPIRPLASTGLRVCSDLNHFYQKIIEANQRVRDWTARQAPEVVLRQEQARLQGLVDALFDNEHCDAPAKGVSGRPLRSLTETIQGKQGRFRQNLLGKRVDYSGRAVIVCGPGLKLHQCGLPRVIAHELFLPFVLNRLAERFHREIGLPWPSATLAASLTLKERNAAVRRVLREVLKARPEAMRRGLELAQNRGPLLDECLREAMAGRRVLLNRAPSLHRMNIQAFEPVLTDEKVLRVPPLVCEGFGADFDGDTMAIHLPLSAEAQDEAAVLMPPERNLLTPASGRPILPTNEIVLGCCYLTAAPGTGHPSHAFADPAEVRRAIEHGKLTVHSVMIFRPPVGTVVVREWSGEPSPVRIRIPPASETNPVWVRAERPGASSCGEGEIVRADVLEEECERLKAEGRQLPAARTLDVSAWPDGLLPGPGGRIVTTAGRVLFFDDLPAGLPFYDLVMTRKVLALVVEDGLRLLGRQGAAELLDSLKTVGFREATRSGLSFDLDDLHLPPERDHLVARAREECADLRQQFDEGKIGDDERYERTLLIWSRVQKQVTDRVRELMRDDGMSGPSLNALYLMAHSGARGKWEQIRQLAGMRGLMARASGRRRTVEQAITHNLREGLTIPEYFLSCHGARKAGADKAALPDAGYLTRRLVDVAHHVVVGEHDCETNEGIRLSPLDAIGRVAVENLDSPEGERLQNAGARVSHVRARALCTAGVDKLWVRSPLTCRSARGVCQMCYGIDPTTRELVEIGTPVGVLAAQSIGEPGTQLAMKTKHTGGVRAEQDMVTGLQRVNALFEAYPTKSRDLHDLLREGGRGALQSYLLRELQEVYRGNGIHLDDRHFEVVIAQMLRREGVEDGGDLGWLPGTMIDKREVDRANRRLAECVFVEDPGDTPFRTGSLVECHQFDETTRSVQAAGMRPPKARAPVPARSRAILLGIRQAAMMAEGFLSAASFEQASQVLMNASLAGRVDPLAGLKENVLLGRLVPLGTGFLEQLPVASGQWPVPTLEARRAPEQTSPEGAGPLHATDVSSLATGH